MLAATALLVPAIAACQPAAPGRPANDGARRAEADNRARRLASRCRFARSESFSGGIAVAGRQTGCITGCLAGGKPEPRGSGRGQAASTAHAHGRSEGLDEQPDQHGVRPVR